MLSLKPALRHLVGWIFRRAASLTTAAVTNAVSLPPIVHAMMSLQPPPAVPQPPIIPSTPDPAVAQTLQQVPGAADMYQAAASQRSELRRQLDRLESRRSDLVRELSDEGQPAASKVSLEARLKEIDARITATDQQLAAADMAVSTAAAIPGATVEPPQPPRTGPPEEYIAIPIVFTLFVLFPMAFAYSRRIWKRAATVIAPVPQEVRDRLEQLSQSVDSIALEVERIGEGQRFITKVMADNGRAIGAGAAQPIPVPQAHAESVGVRRDG